LQTEDSIWATPNSAEAWAAVAPPPGVKLSIEPIGAIITGSRMGRPRKVPVASTLDTSRSTRGRNPRESMASRLRRRVVSVSVPPTR
jgi:hypothetical protein